MPRFTLSAFARAGLLLTSGGVLGAAIACGSDAAVVDADGSTASVSGNAGGAGVSSADTATPDSADDAAIEEAPPDEGFPWIEECSTGQASEPCGWSLASELTGAQCSPGELLQLGCCDCGQDAVLRVCDGNMACSDRAAIGFGDDNCQMCPTVTFNCPDSGVFSALAGRFPSVSEDGSANAAGMVACEPKLIRLSDSSGGGSDAGTTSFDTIHPILVSNCGRCHADAGFGSLLGLPQFANSDIEIAYQAARSFGEVILPQINSGVMPPDSCGGRAPGSEGCVSAADFDLIRKWYIAGTPR